MVQGRMLTEEEIVKCGERGVNNPLYLKPGRKIRVHAGEFNGKVAVIKNDNIAFSFYFPDNLELQLKVEKTEPAYGAWRLGTNEARAIQGHKIELLDSKPVNDLSVPFPKRKR